MGARMLVKGMLTWIPGVQRAFFDPSAGGGTGSATYCYGVWMKHLVLLWEQGMRDIPGTVVELGPGSSIGTGVATLLSGAHRYIAIDAVPHMRPETNVAALQELVQLFRLRASRPTAGYPPIDHLLDERLFPSHILDESRLARALAPKRLERIDHAVRAAALGHPDPMIEYHTWSTPRPVAPCEADLVFSHVVMNHVDDLERVYGLCGQWVRPGGWMSHQIDFTSLGTADEWNGHRAYSDLAWKVIAGRRPYFVNREPLATHLAAIEKSGFQVIDVIRGRKEGGIAREELAPRWQGISDEDHATQTGFIVARKRWH
jgi:SAM-dependent methyltransferase